MNRIFLPLFLIHSVFADSIHADQNKPESPFSRDVVGSDTEETFGILELDSEVFRNTSDDFSDLRLLRDGNPVSYWITPHSTTSPRVPSREIQSRIQSFQELENGSIELIILVGDGNDLVSQVQIETPLRDFEKTVNLSVSDEGENWRSHLENAVLFDYSEFLDFRRTSFEFKPVEARYLRLHISEATDEQRASIRDIAQTVYNSKRISITEQSQILTRKFRIDSLKLFRPAVEREAGEPPVFESLPIEETTETESRSHSRIIFDGGRLPLTAFTVETADRNFQRRFELQVQLSEDPEQWRTITRSKIFRYRFDDWHDESLTISVSETRASRYRLIVDNGNSAPLNISGIKGTRSRYDMIFENAGTASLKLVYGGIDTARPIYDTAAFQLARKKEAGFALFKLGGEVVSTVDAGEARKVDWWRRRELLWIVIAMATAGLIAIPIFALKKINKATK